MLINNQLIILFQFIVLNLVHYLREIEKPDGINIIHLKSSGHD